MLFRSRLWHLLVAPGFPIPTRTVYQAFSLTVPGPDVKLLHRALRGNDVAGIRNFLFNTLEPAVEALYPAIRYVKDTIVQKTGVLRPMVSGSGSTVMAVCESESEAQAAVQALRSAEPGWQVFVASTGA